MPIDKSNLSNFQPICLNVKSITNRVKQIKPEVISPISPLLPFSFDKIHSIDADKRENSREEQQTNVHVDCSLVKQQSLSTAIVSNPLFLNTSENYTNNKDDSNKQAFMSSNTLSNSNEEGSNSIMDINRMFGDANENVNILRYIFQFFFYLNFLQSRF